MKIASWNVNGVRAVANKGFWNWFDAQDADIVCLQETKAFPSQLTPDLRAPLGYHAIWHEGKTPGYAGVVIFSKIKPLSEKAIFHDLDQFHLDGRVVEARFEDFVLLNIYFPNGSPRADGREMLAYKLDFYDKFIGYANHLRSEGLSVIACGDFNICHKEIDIARPKENANSIGFLPVERQKLDEFVAHGYTDCFRRFYPDVADKYTWWSYRGGARERNVGWRLDYFFVSDDLIGKVKKVEHQEFIYGSDHCPIILEV
jgi:exodeoxyribonuclease-3